MDRFSIKRYVLFSLCFLSLFSCSKDNERISFPEDILSLYPDYLVRPILVNYKFGTYQWGEKDIKPYTPLTLLWFSDIHSNMENLQRIKSFYDYYQNYIDDVLFTGDFKNGGFEDSYSPWGNVDCNSFLCVIGNHDAAEILSPFKPVSPQKCYKKYIEPYIKETNVICKKNTAYWYKDYPLAKSSNCPRGIRIIALDQYHWKEGEWSSVEAYEDGSEVDRGQQEKWLVDLLNDSREKGFAIIMTTHSPSNNTECIPIMCSFDTLDRCSNQSNEALRADILDDVQDFINKGGEFICWLCGHTHQDWFTRLSYYPEQIQIVLGTSSYNMMWRDTDMVHNTKYMDRFNIFSVEPESKYIRIYRIGVDHDRHGRHIGSVVYDYKNKVLISND